MSFLDPTTPPLPPGTTVLEASAGTGKTFVIAHKVLRLVAEASGAFPDGVRVERMVVLTFTRAATADLRTRVRQRLQQGLTGLVATHQGEAWSAPDDTLRDWVDACPAAERRDRIDRLRRALRDFDIAGIATLHALCQRILRRNAFRSGWLLDASIEPTLPDLVHDLATDFFTALVYDAHPSVIAALDKAGVTLRSLKNLAEKASNSETVLLPAAPHPPPDVRLPNLDAWAAARDHLEANWDVDAVVAALSDPSVIVQKKNSQAGLEHSMPPGRVVGSAGSVRGSLDRSPPSPAAALPTAFGFFAPGEIQKATMPGAAPPTNPSLAAMAAFLVAHEAVQPEVQRVIQGARHALVHRVRTELARTARDRGRRSYDDLLTDLRDALSRTGGRGGPLARAVREQIDVALIDEFQDTDPIQWEVFSTLFADRLMMLVGDPKQAIYAFRGADVFTYQGAKAHPEVSAPVFMDQSFRADGPLHDAVYGLFGRDLAMGRDDLEVPAVRAVRGTSSLVGDSRPPLQMRYLPSAGVPRNRYNKDLIRRTWLNERIPALVAADVARELARGGRLTEGGAQRPVLASDCAVLVSTNRQAAEVQVALRRLGVPSVIRTRSGILASAAAGALLDVLAAIVSPYDPRRIRRGLASLLMGRSAPVLASLTEEAVGPFHAWSRTWKESGFAAMFRAFLDDDDVLPRLLRLDGGQRIAADLIHLGEFLTAAEAERRLGPTALLRWARDGGPGHDEDDARVRLDDDADAVRVTTMHSAKGLEWGLVWCPYLWDGVYLEGDDRRYVQFHDPDNDHRRTMDIGSVHHDARVAIKRKQDFEESLRLTYVALTRAKYRCVFYWGPAHNTTWLAWLLFTDLSLWTNGTYSPRKTVSRPDADLLHDLRALEARIQGLELAPVRWDTDLAAARPATSESFGEFRPRTLTRTRPPDGWWRRSSFSGLRRSRGEAEPPADVPDHDDELPEEDLDEVPDGALVLPGGEERVTLADLQAGAGIGSALHAVLEHHDFARPEELDALVEEHVVGAGFGVDVAVVAGALREAVATPLDASGLRLADIPRSARMDEWGFTFPAAGGLTPTGQVTTKTLAAAYDGEPDLPDGWVETVRGLGFLPLRGFLTGAVDLVFRHEERWYVADYKSNKLGETFADYAPAHVDAHMVSARYVLQAHLYTVALHRFLSRRLPDYDYDRDVGGCLWMFLRGMHPDRPGSGVWAHKPSRSLVERLDVALGGSA